MSKILIVDDELPGRELLVALVRHGGHQPLEAADGAEALERVRAERPHLVICDILLPTMDGYEFVRRLRGERDLAGIPVIFYTANYDEKDALKLAEIGHVTRVLIKPCEPEVILQAIEEAIAGSGAAVRQEIPKEFNTKHLKLLTDKLWQRTMQLESANTKLAALTRLHVQLASENESEVLLRQLCTNARNLFGAKYAVLAARDKAASGLSSHFACGLDAEAEPPVIDAGALGRVLATGKPWRVSRDDGTTIDAGLPGSYPPARAFLVVPLVSLTEVYGWICLAEKVGAIGFNEEDESLLSNLCAQVSRIYENSRLNKELQLRAHRLREEISQGERATSGLRASEERFRRLAENIQDAFFVASGDLCDLSYLSPAYSRIWGRTSQIAASCVDVLMEGIHPDDADRVRADYGRISAGLVAGAIKYRIQRPDQSVRWIQVRIFPVQDTAASDERVVGTVSDVTDNHLAGARIEHLNRVYAVLSSINTLIVRVRERDELFHEACRLAVQFGRFAIAWIGWLEPKSGVIRAEAWAGANPDFLASVSPLMGPDPEKDGIVAAAVRSGQPRYANDLKTDPQYITLRAEMLANGFRGVMALPLIIDEKAAGCLVLVTAEADFFSDEERRLLVELAGDISFALDHLEKADRLYYLAYYDALTGLANRTLFLDRLGQQLVHAPRARRKLALVAMAPERLSNINDTFGRPAGDLVLKQFSERFAEAVGTESEIGRVSGDQIATLVDATDGEAEILARVSRWQEYCFGRPFDIHGTQMRLGATTGIAMYPDDGVDAVSLLKNAEAALERAKITGDEHLFYTQRMSVVVTEKLMLEHSLREATERQEFQLYYQPKVDIEKRRVRGLEALIRWNNPERGLVLPGIFVPLMEETGMIVSVGAWVIRQAAEERVRWREMGLVVPRVAVNVSTIQIRKRDFVRTVQMALQDFGKAPGIDIEVTESLIMEDVEGNIQKLEEISRMGVGIALDDFGTGYSSLGYLAKLPVETLKIDRSFIAKMLDDPGAMTLVSTMISLAHSLKLTVVAEGVETEEQAKILRLLRCDEIQGYLVSRPLPFDAMADFLKQART